MSADTKITPSEGPFDGLKDTDALKLAAHKLGIEITNEILPGVIQNIELLSTHYANVREAKSET